MPISFHNERNYASSEGNGHKLFVVVQKQKLLDWSVHGPRCLLILQLRAVQIDGRPARVSQDLVAARILVVVCLVECSAQR